MPSRSDSVRDAERARRGRPRRSAACLFVSLLLAAGGSLACASGPEYLPAAPPDVEGFAGARPDAREARELAQAAIRDLLGRALREGSDGSGRTGDLDRALYHPGELELVQLELSDPTSWVWAQPCTVVFRGFDGDFTGGSMPWTVYFRDGAVVGQAPGRYGAPYSVPIGM